jgi:hypothetical protein
MIDRVMFGELFAELAVSRRLIGHDVAFARKVIANDRQDFGLCHFVNMERPRRATALNERQNSVLVFHALFDLDTLLVANERLIDFHDQAAAAQRRKGAGSHSLPDAMAEKPCRLKRDPEGPMQLICAEALLGRAKKLDCDQPISHLDMAIFENRADLDRELFAAGVAFIEADAVTLAFERAGLIDNAAMRANTAIRPKPRFNEGVGGGFVIEVSGGENGTGHGKISLCPNAITSGWSRQLEHRRIRPRKTQAFLPGFAWFRLVWFGSIWRAARSAHYHRGTWRGRNRPLAAGGGEAHRNDLSGFGIVAEAGRVGHADELVVHCVADRFERLRNHGPKDVGIGPVADDHEFPIVELVGSARVCGIVERHREGILAHVKRAPRVSILLLVSTRYHLVKKFLITPPNV